MESSGYEFPSFTAPNGCPEPELAYAAAEAKIALESRLILDRRPNPAHLSPRYILAAVGARLLRVGDLTCPALLDGSCQANTECQLPKKLSGSSPENID